MPSPITSELVRGNAFFIVSASLSAVSFATAKDLGWVLEDGQFGEKDTRRVLVLKCGEIEGEIG